jgi:hypothetical protein
MHTVRYAFTLPDGRRLELAFEFDERFELVLPPRAAWPEWTRLDFNGCDDCPLRAGAAPRCPLAASLVEVVEAAGALVSHTTVEVEVTFGGRKTTLTAPAMDALRSLMGMLIPASGCPRTAFFRPMARFHVPLSGPEETLYRATSMFRLAQHLRQSRGLAPEEGLAGLAAIYGALNVVNRHLAERLRAACEKDSALNAVALLDVFAQLLPMQLDEPLDELAVLFAAYLDG